MLDVNIANEALNTDLTCQPLIWWVSSPCLMILNGMTYCFQNDIIFLSGKPSP